MNKNIKRFILICKQKQMDLKEFLVSFLKAHDYEPIVDDGFIYANGTDEVCLTAHLDTVHEKNAIVKDVNVKKNIISSPQGIGGDDRCGVYMIMEIIKQGFHPCILFCEDEEVGGIGSEKFVRFVNVKDKIPFKFFIELDRANANDLVFYDDDNKEFHNWCEEITGYKTSIGSFSDISNLCPYFKVSGVNVSCGYYNAHRLNEYVIFDEMENSIKTTVKLIEAAKELTEPWEYIECKRYSSYNVFGYGYNTSSSLSWSEEWVFVTADNKEYYGYGKTLVEAAGDFLMDNPEIKWGDVIDYYSMDDYFECNFGDFKSQLKGVKAI